MDHVRIKTLIKTSLERIHNATDLAEIAGVSFDSLRKDFRRREGVSLARYIRVVRVETMKELISNTDDSCLNISFKVGFSREEIGSRVFKRVTGVTMTEFRKLCVDPESGSGETITPTDMPK